ncbi:MAG: hypothetical protein LQ351_003974 [Letrouitia transgressa]|nr:MAG: hypothetical protein LQ351_003974 [Letrouitia transgressa]
MRIRVRTPAGQFTLSLLEDATIGDLQSTISDKTSIPAFDLKYGYPPRPLFWEDYDQSAKITEIAPQLNNEQLIVVGKQNTPSEAFSTPRSNDDLISPPSNAVDVPVPDSAPFSFTDVGEAPTADVLQPGPRQTKISAEPLSLARKSKLAADDPPEIPVPSHSSTLVLRIMPDDNSCLFRAFSSAFFGIMDNMTELRSIIATYIQEHRDKYSEVVLEKPPDDYCRWIRTENSWGGAIELDILSRHFEVEICSIDVQTLRIDRYNEFQTHRCILVYSGIHYDTIALSPSDAPFDHADAPPDFDTKMFDSADDAILEHAVELCRKLQSMHYFTDTAKFNILCNICKRTFVGEQGAIEHAQATSHYDFGEAG